VKLELTTLALITLLYNFGSKRLGYLILANNPENKYK
jgi:hypothetical protein